MAANIVGLSDLQRRLKALQKTPRPLLATIQIDTVAGAKRRVARKTGFTARSIRRGELTNSYAIVAAGGAAVFLEHGTKPHVIRPRRSGGVLAWPASASGRRLSGSARSGAEMVFARKVNHPGTKPQPFLIPAAQDALDKSGWTQIPAKLWNGAA